MTFNPLVDFNLLNLHASSRKGNGLTIMKVEEVVTVAPPRVLLRDAAQDLTQEVSMATSDYVAVGDSVILVDLPNGLRVAFSQDAAGLPAGFTTRSACRSVRVTE